MKVSEKSYSSDWCFVFLLDICLVFGSAVLICRKGERNALGSRSFERFCRVNS